MDKIYQYPVYFECHSLLEEHKKKIRNYFSIYRKSSGGECGPLRSVNGGVYRIAFKDQNAQQRVLQKSKHVVEFQDGSLVFTVRDRVEPQTSSTINPSDDFTAAQSPQSVSASTPPPSGEEYELQTDTFLLCYLHECPKALNKLQEKLTTVFCCAQIYPEEGRVLVRSSAKPNAADEGRNWKSQVHKIFDGYLCHYEVDPHKVKALLQSCSSHQTTDEVKVYSEGVMAVVVGECSQVSARLMDVEDSAVKCQGSRLREKQTSVHQLGEAKLCLLWKEIKHSLEQDFPGVMVSQGDAGQLVLEGYVEEILQALAWVSDKENLVLERTNFDHSPRFLAFLRKAYGGCLVCGDILGLGDEVAIEFRDTQLHYFTLSADKLDETQKTLQSKFKEIKTDVPNCSVVPSELQEMLKSMTNEINQGQCKLQVVFSGSTVHLLGHSKEVEELSEIVTQFISDQSIVQSPFQFPFLVSAQELPEFLQLHEFDFSGVVFHPLTSSSETVVVLEGPSCKVAEIRNRLGLFLDSLLQDEVTTNPLREVECFQSSSHKDKFPNVGKYLSQHQYDTVAQHLASLNLSEGNVAVAGYSLCDGVQVLVCQGDITKQEADALVNAANEDLDHCGGVAAALSKAGGPEVQKESKALVKQTGKISTGDVVVTTGGNLKCKKLLHAVGPVWGKAGGRERFLLEKTVKSALNLAEMMEFKSIAMPCISSGVFGVPVTVCSEAIVTAVKEFGSQGGRSLSTIILIDNREEVVRAMLEACDRLLQGISIRNDTPSDLGFQMGATAGAAGYVHVETTHTENQQQAYMSVQEGFTNDIHNLDHVSTTKRIILLGKTGAGKSSLANIIFREELFTTNHTANSGTKVCQAETRRVNERSITLIDTPGLFDVERSEEELKPEIMNCITECAPGHHAFLIVLKVEKFTEQEKAVIDKICEYFSEDALKYAVIVFTHGDQLPERTTIEEFISQNKNLSDLVEKCGGRCHVFDNTYWKNKQQNNYRSNQFQVEELLNTIDKMVMENNGGYYTNEMLQVVEEEIKKEEEHIKQTSGNMSPDEIRKQATTRVFHRLLIQLSGTATGALLGAFFGVETLLRLVIPALQKSDVMYYVKSVSKIASQVGVKEGTLAATVVLGVTTAAGITGGVIGAVAGHKAAEGAETAQEAAERAYKAVKEEKNATLKNINNFF